jgi:hypothetical protein
MHFARVSGLKFFMMHFKSLKEPGEYGLVLFLAVFEKFNDL